VTDEALSNTSVTKNSSSSNESAYLLIMSILAFGNSNGPWQKNPDELAYRNSTLLGSALSFEYLPPNLHISTKSPDMDRFTL